MKPVASALHRTWRALRFFVGTVPIGAIRAISTRVCNSDLPRPYASIACITAACIFLVGCHGEPRADLVIINGNEPESLDPAIVTAVPDMRIAKALFEGLARLNGKSGRPEPGLAERWDVSPDGRTYTFYLRTNTAWSTGERISTADVTYSWLRALNPATASDYAGQLFYIRNAEPYYSGKLKNVSELGIRALDARTFQVELEYPVAFFLDLCCYPTLAVVPAVRSRSMGIAGSRNSPCRAADPLNWSSGG